MIKNHFEPKEKFCVIKTDRYNKSIDGMIRKIPESPSWTLPSLFKENLDMLRVESVGRGDTAPAKLYITRAQQASTGFFQSTLNDGQQFMLEFDDGLIPVVGEYKNSYTDANYWLRAFYLAMIMRSEHAIAILSQVTEEVFKADGLGSDNFDNQLAALYKAIYNPEANLAEQMVRTTASFVPNEFTDARFRYVSRIFWPQIAILNTIFMGGKETEFNQEMEKALKLHKEYWVKNDDSAAEGVIPLHLIALTVLAHDQAGYELRVENGYIFDWMVHFSETTDQKRAGNNDIAPAEISTIPVAVLTPLKNNDIGTLEALRERDHSAYLPELIALYESEEDWALRESIIYMLQDRRKEKRLKGIMENALQSPLHQVQGLALIWLNGPDWWDKVLTNSAIDAQKVKPLVDAYLAEHQK